MVDLKPEKQQANTVKATEQLIRAKDASIAELSGEVDFLEKKMPTCKRVILRYFA